MLKRLVEAAGVDYVQWRALLRTKLMIDYSALLGAYGPVAARRAGFHLLLQCVIFGMLGLMPAVVILFARDPFFASTLMITTTTSLVAMFVFMLASTLISPDDYAVIGYRPVSSRTYFAARVTGLLLTAGEIVVMNGYPSIAAFLLRTGGAVGVTAAAFAAILASAVAAALAVAALYGWLLQRMAPARLQRLVAIIALVGILLIGGANFLGFHLFVDFGDDMSLQVSVDQTLARTPWVLLYPPVWFAAYTEVARGAAGWLEWTASALSAGLLVALAATLRGGISLGYARRIAESTTAPAGIVKADPAWRLLVNERRALAVLMRHMVRTDTTLQTGMLMQILMAAGFVIYFSMNLPPDPFLSTGHRVQGTSLFMLFLIPRGLRQDMVMSQSSRASWLFFSTPADRAALVIAMRDLIAVGVLPWLFAGVGAFLIYAYGHVGHALMDAALLCAMSYVTLQVDAAFDPRLPFSVPYMTRTGSIVPRGNWRVFLACIAVYEAFDLSRHFFYQTRWGVTAVLVGITAIIWGLNRLTRARVARMVQSAEYFE